MIDLNDRYLLMVEPDREGEPSSIAIEDELTKKVEYLYSLTTLPKYQYKGVHTTRCGQRSDNNDHFLPNGVIMNSLCVYYIKHYREFIPESEIEKINKVYKELELY